MASWELFVWAARRSVQGSFMQRLLKCWIRSASKFQIGKGAEFEMELRMPLSLSYYIVRALVEIKLEGIKEKEPNS